MSFLVVIKDVIMKQICDVFSEVRQRVAAYKLHCKMYGKRCPDDDTLDDVFRFLYGSCTDDFLQFCAKEEGFSDIEKYKMAIGYYE